MERLFDIDLLHPGTRTHHHLPALLAGYREWLEVRGFGSHGLLIAQFIDRYTRDLHGDRPSGRAARSMLLNHLVADTRSVRASGVALHRYPDSPNRAGYTLADELEFRDAASSEPSSVLRHSLGVSVALAAGCGLKASEIPDVNVDDVTVENVVAVRVGAISIPCRLLWADLLVKAAEGRRREIESNGEQLRIFGPAKPDGDESLLGHRYRTDLVHKTPLAGRLVSYKRCRTTFIVRHLEAGTPAKHIVSAARFRSAAALTRYIELAAPASSEDLLVSMGGVR